VTWRGAGVFGLFLVVVVAALGAYQLSRWTPTIPTDAASATITQATPHGQQDCLNRIASESGWLDLCWNVIQEEDGDPVKDYYELTVRGTASGAGTGIRWWRVRTNLNPAGAPVMDSVFDGRPSGPYTGACQETPINAFPGTGDEVCGYTLGEYAGIWGYRVTWNCVGCVFAGETKALPVIMHFSVGVPQGQKPIFDIGADFGA
jgi:hypothetical protein